MSRPLAPKGGNDRVYTPPELARRIVQHFQPSGRLLEPCKGRGAFVAAMQPFDELVQWCEKDEGRDFLTLTGETFNWIITNPPWSQLRAFLNKSMQVADNVVFLCLVNAFFMKARQADMKATGFGMKEIVFVPTPSKPWPQTGFSLGAVHIQRDYEGPCLMTDKTEEWRDNLCCLQ
jgi:hypothetical protein